MEHGSIEGRPFLFGCIPTGQSESFQQVNFWHWLVDVFNLITIAKLVTGFVSCYCWLLYFWKDVLSVVTMTSAVVAAILRTCLR